MLKNLLVACLLLAAATAVVAEEDTVFDETPEMDEEPAFEAEPEAEEEDESMLDLETEEADFAEDEGGCATVSPDCKLSSTCSGTTQLQTVCQNYQGKGPYKLTYEIDANAKQIPVAGCSSCKPAGEGGPMVTSSSSACSRAGGRCGDKRRSNCSSGWKSGMCPGSWFMKCCISSSTGGGGAPTNSANTKCGKAGGNCVDTARSRCNGSTASGACPGASSVKCCFAPRPPVGNSCGAYGSMSTSPIKGNNEVTYNVVKIRKQDLTSPSYANYAPDKKDNTMTKDTACAFARLQAAAKAKGYTVTINSGFRTIARQKYFWNCYQTKRCNNGNKAARPGTSNHGKGRALDLQLNADAYNWMRYNAQTYGFVRTVASETWHWEHRPGTNCRAFVPYNCL